MFDIRDHGGNYGGGKKPEEGTFKFISSKTFTNPFGTYQAIGDIISDNTIDLYNGSDPSMGNRSLNYDTGIFQTITSNNSYRKNNLFIFGQYLIETADGSKIIKIYNKDMALVKQITLNIEFVEGSPYLHASPDDSYALIYAYRNSYYGYNHVFKLNKDLTISTGVEPPRATPNWRPLSPTKMITVVDRNLHIASISTGLVEKSIMGFGYDISTPFIDLGRFLHISTVSGIETTKMYFYNGVDYNEITKSIIVGYNPFSYGAKKLRLPYKIDKQEKSLIHIPFNSTTSNKFKWVEGVVSTSTYGVIENFRVLDANQTYAYDFDKSKYVYVITSNQPNSNQITVMRLLLI